MSNATVCLSRETVSHMQEGDCRIDVAINILTIPPHAKLSRQWHHSEEFAYIVEGFIILHQEDRPDEFFKKGDVGKIPLSQVHRVSTQEEGATILIFSVQEDDQTLQIFTK